MVVKDLSVSDLNQMSQVIAISSLVLSCQNRTKLSNFNDKVS